MNATRVWWRAARGLVAMSIVAAGCASAGSDEASEPTPSLAPDVAGPTVTEVVELPVDTAAEIVVGDKSVVTRSGDVEDGVDGVLPEGVGSVTARVTSADGVVCEVCLWLADDDAARQRGLMGVTDLGDAVGMAFRWEQPTTGNFFMFQTPTPLSIAWFDAAGSHVGQADMAPCMVSDAAVCERYGADAAYTLGIEMFGGQLGAIGIGPGSNIELLDLTCASIPG